MKSIYTTIVFLILSLPVFAAGGTKAVIKAKGCFIKPYESAISECKNRLGNFVFELATTSGKDITIRVSNSSREISNSSIHSPVIKHYNEGGRANWYEIRTPELEIALFRPSNNSRSLITVRVLKTGDDFGRHIFLDTLNGNSIDEFLKLAKSSNCLSISSVTSLKDFDTSTQQIINVMNDFLSH